MKHLASRKFQLIDAFNDFVRPFEGERGGGQGRRADRRMKRLKMVSADSREVDSGEPIWIIGRLGVTRAPVTTPR